MKTIVIFLVVSLFSVFASAQQCESYFPQVQGKKYIYKEFDKKSKPTGIVIEKTVLEKKSISGGVQVTIKETHKNDKENTSTDVEYTIKCVNGVMTMNMESYLANQEQMQAYEGMETRVDADDLSIPTDAKAGDDMGGGMVTAEVYNQGMKLMALHFYIKDRKVEARESLTTEAGTFDCLKVSSTTEMKMVVKITSKLTEWYAKDVGVVKSNVYDKKGKLISSTVLVGIE